MAILTRHEILKQIESKMILISPFEIEQLGSNSYDLTLFPELEEYISETLDPAHPASFNTRKIKIPDKGLLLEAGSCYLGRTNEYTETKCFVPVLHGKSSIGRMFLSVGTDAGYGDIGYKGTWTFGLKPSKSVWVYPNMKIVQIEYNTIEGLIRHTYTGKYQDSKDIQASKTYQDYREQLEKQNLTPDQIKKMMEKVKIEID